MRLSGPKQQDRSLSISDGRKGRDVKILVADAHPSDSVAFRSTRFFQIGTQRPSTTELKSFFLDGKCCAPPEATETRWSAGQLSSLGLPDICGLGLYRVVREVEDFCRRVPSDRVNRWQAWAIWSLACFESFQPPILTNLPGSDSL